MKNSKLLKVFEFALIGLCAIVLLDLLMSIGDASTVIRQYDSVKPDSTAGLSKKVQFLKEYTITTGDITLAVSMGMDESTAQQWVDDNNRDKDEDTGTRLATGDWKTKLTDLQANGSYKKYFTANCYVTSTGYYYECQGRSRNQIKSGTGSTCGSVGCGFYAACMAKTYLTGQIYTTVDYLHEYCGWNGDDGDVVYGTAPSRPDYCFGTGIVSQIGLKAEVLNQTSFSPAQGDIYIVYGYSNTSAKTGNHWRCMLVTGDPNTDSKPFFIMPNCNEQEGVEISKSELGSLYTTGGAASENNGWKQPADWKVIYKITNQ